MLAENGENEASKLQDAYFDIHALAIVKKIVDGDEQGNYPFGMPGFDYPYDDELVLRNIQWIAMRQKMHIPQYPNQYQVVPFEFGLVVPLLELSGGSNVLIDRLVHQVEGIKESFFTAAKRLGKAELISLFDSMREALVQSYLHNLSMDDEDTDQYSLANVLDADDALPYKNGALELLPLSQIMERMMNPVIPDGKLAKEAFGKDVLSPLYDPQGIKEDSFLTKNPVYIAFLQKVQEYYERKGNSLSLSTLQSLLESAFRQIQNGEESVYTDALAYHIRMQFPLLVCLVTRQGFGAYKDAAHVVLSL